MLLASFPWMFNVNFITVHKNQGMLSKSTSGVEQQAAGARVELDEARTQATLAREAVHHETQARVRAEKKLVRWLCWLHARVHLPCVDA